MILHPIMLLQALINGLLLGGIYALVAIGLNLVFGVIKVINFAHGEFLMLGLYTAYWLAVLYGIDPYISLPIIVLVTFMLGVLTQKMIIEPLLKAPPLNQLLATAGLSLVLQNVALSLWRADYRAIMTAYAGLSITVGPLMISVVRLVSFLAAISVALTFYLFLMRTDLGRSIRAIAHDKEIAELMAIDVKRHYVMTFGIGGALAGITAALIAPIYFVYPTVGAPFGLMSFIVVVLGGLGSFVGALFGGLILGVVESIAGFLTNAELARAFAFAIFLIILFIKPSGIFGEKARV